MTRKLTVGPAALVLAGFMAFPVFAAENSNAGVQWDPKASEELAHALHQLHEVWNTGNIRGLKDAMIGDDALVTFELDAKTHKPIRLASKRDLDSFVESVATDLEEDGTVQELATPVVNCRATATFGVCTEECTVRTKKKDGVETLHRLWSTNLAVKQNGEWKWIQWHMSKAGPTETYKGGKLVTAN